MGSCVSRSTATAVAASTPAVGLLFTAKVVFQDGSMAQFVAPATAGDALGADIASSSSCFVCCSDELRFDAPARALAAHDALRPGQLYFVLPISALGRPLSGQNMATLAVKAIAAHGASASAVAVDNDRAATAAGGSSGSVPSSRGKNARATGKQRPQTARGAPLVADADADHVYGGNDSQKTVHGDRTVGKARISGGGHRGSIARQREGLQRLTAISEGSELSKLVTQV